MSYKTLRRINKALSNIVTANSTPLLLFAYKQENDCWSLRGESNTLKVDEHFTSEKNLETWLEEHDHALCIKIVYGRVCADEQQT